MNKIKLIIVLAGLSVIFPACDDFLDRSPLDETTEDAFFKKPGEFIVFVNRFHPYTGKGQSPNDSWGDVQTDVQITNTGLPERFLGLSTINDGPDEEFTLGFVYEDIRRVN